MSKAKYSTLTRADFGQTDIVILSPLASMSSEKHLKARSNLDTKKIDFLVFDREQNQRHFDELQEAIDAYNAL